MYNLFLPLNYFFCHLNHKELGINITVSFLDGKEGCTYALAESIMIAASVE